MCTRRRIHSLPTVDLCHPSHTSASQARILVAVTPTVYCSLNETSLSPQAWIEVSQSPAYRVALRLVVQSIPLVLILGTTSARIHAILRFELLRKCICIHGLYIAPNRVLHLDAISRILESDPLHTVLVLSDNERCRCRYWARRCVWIDACTRWALM